MLTFLYLKLPIVFRDYDSSILNLFHNIRGSVKTDGKVVIAAINDASIVEYGDWPWKRTKIAELIDSIAACKPSVIVLNFYFRKKSTLTTDERDKEIVLSENRALSNSIRKAGNVIIPFNFEKFQDEQSVTALEAPPEEIMRYSIRKVTNTSQDIVIVPAKVIHSPEPEIAKSSKGLGFNNVLAGTQHYSLQAVRYGNNFFPSIGVAAAAVYLQGGMDETTLNIGSDISFRSGIKAPIDDYGISMINFFGPNGTFPNYTASEILGRNFNPDLLQDKIVIVGLTDKRNGEPNKTPYSDNLPASELWANIIENILSQNTPFILFSNMILMLVLPLLIIIGISFLTNWCLSLRFKKALMAVAAAFLFILVLSFALFLFNMWFSALIPISYLFGLALFLLFRSYRHPELNMASSSQGANGSGSNTALFTSQGKLVRIGRYQVLQEIGSGSMGTVYKALDPKINRTIAIKTLKYSVALSGRNELRERFSREAHAAGTLSHSNIVTIYDYGETENMSYIAMEYIEGKSLEEKLAEKKRLEKDEVVRLIKQVAQGLSVAHAQGIIHRDIKPGNIMFIGNSGDIKIMDFGVAKIESATMTDTGKTLGTPYYMSPEQFNGDAIDLRSDIFSLGVIAYEALSGGKPFTGVNLSALSYSILHKEHQPITEICPDLPQAVNAVFDKVLSKEPETRYKSAIQFATTLSDTLAIP